MMRTVHCMHRPRRYKQPVGARLARSALATAYGASDVQTHVTAVASPHPSPGSISISVSVSNGSAADHGSEAAASMAAASIDVRTPMGFEVLGSDGLWHSTPITGHHAGRNGTLTLGGSPPGARAIRYLAYMAPCTQQPYKCAVYARVDRLGAESGEMEWLPLGPFVQSFEGEEGSGQS